MNASGYHNFQLTKNIYHDHRKRLHNEPQFMDEFISLVSGICTFVDIWTEEETTPPTYRLYGRKVPGK